jgi:hypothetical protein
VGRKEGKEKSLKPSKNKKNEKKLTEPEKAKKN